MATRSEVAARIALGGGSGTPVESTLVNAVEGIADVISVAENTSAATTTESPTETPF